MRNSTTRSRRNKVALYFALSALTLLSAVTGLLLGAAELSLGDLFGALRAGMGSRTPEALILWYARMPRVLGSLLSGAALAVSGAVIQGVLSNGLASPSVIGVNAGAGLAVTACAAAGVMGGWRLSLAAFAGAFAAVMAVSLGARRFGASRGTVILMGVAMNSLLGAFSDAITVLAPEVAVQRNGFRIGDFSAVTYPKLIPAAAVILLSLLIISTLTNELEVLSLGEDGARALGLNTGAVRTLLLMLAAALAGAAVSMAGLLSFVGLMVPHALRLLSGGEARRLIPLCALAGAGFVTACDTLSRVILAPYEFPVGIVMAFLGAPFFLFILIRGKGGHGRA